MQILIVEDEIKIADIPQRGLTEERYHTDIARNGKDALEKFSHNRYNLLIVDLMIPEIDGLTVCRKIRLQDTNIPILMLTAKEELQDKIAGLDAGADDYVIKPFSIDEVAARVRALLRRGKSADAPVLAISDLTLYPSAKTVTRRGTAVILTGREYALLEYLMRHTGQVLSRNQILENVWDNSYEGISNIVETYIRYLRRKLKVTPDCKELIHTIQGRGYILQDE